MRARKGVLITTSWFSEEAKDYVQRIEKRIVLVDGKQLADLMIDHDIGVNVVQTYQVKRLDTDYFEGAAISHHSTGWPGSSVQTSVPGKSLSNSTSCSGLPVNGGNVP